MHTRQRLATSQKLTWYELQYYLNSLIFMSVLLSFLKFVPISPRRNPLDFWLFNSLLVCSLPLLIDWLIEFSAPVQHRSYERCCSGWLQNNFDQLQFFNVNPVLSTYFTGLCNFEALTERRKPLLTTSKCAMKKLAPNWHSNIFQSYPYQNAATVAGNQTSDLAFGSSMPQ